GGGGGSRDRAGGAGEREGAGPGAGAAGRGRGDGAAGRPGLRQSAGVLERQRGSPGDRGPRPPGERGRAVAGTRGPNRSCGTRGMLVEEACPESFFELLWIFLDRKSVVEGKRED